MKKKMMAALMWIFCLGILLTGGEKAQAAGGQKVTEVNTESNYTQYAYCNAKQYTVRFREYNLQKHLIVWNRIEKVTYGKTYGKAIWKPKKTGYTFLGWYSAPTGGKKITGSTKVTIAKDHFLYARWKPNKPATVKITAKAFSGNGVKIYWKEAKAVEGYTIYRATSKNGTYKKIKDVYTGSESWTDEDAQYVYDFDTDKVAFKDVGLKTGKTYYYKVAAFRNDNGKKKYGDKSKAVGIKL